MEQTLSILAVNVNGLRDNAKRKDFLLHILKGHWDVVVLTETHCPDDATVVRWLAEGAGPGQPWQGPAFWHHGTSRSRGVAVLLRSGYVCEDAKVDYTSGCGRVLRVSWQPAHGQRLAVVAVYAPHVAADRPAFFAQDGVLQPALLAAPVVAAADVFLAGDFNCVMRPEDVWGGASNLGNRGVGATQLASMLAASGLRDVWGTLHGHRESLALDAFTYLSRDARSRATGARLDYIMAPAHLMSAGWVGSCTHRRDVQPSDHAAVELYWRAPKRTPRGRWRWVFPDSLLRNQEFLDSAVKEASRFRDGWRSAAPGSAWAARDKYEAVKEFIVQLATQKYAALTAQRRSAVQAAKQAERAARLALLRASPDRAAEAYVQWKDALYALQEAGGLSASHRQGGVGPVDLLWEVAGEQSTKYFHRLGRQNPAAPVGMTSIKVSTASGGSQVHSVHESGGLYAVGQALSAYFDGRSGGLFAPGQVDPRAQQLMLGSISSFVPTEEAKTCLGPRGDGTLTLPCLAEALKGVPGGRAPGSDGLTYEALKAFWSVLGPLLVDSCNEAFASETEEGLLLTRSQRSGVIQLIHKGGGKPVDDITAHRPITLLNCDYKLVARVLVQRFTPAAEAVVDPGQTAFLPGRWIGDNILQHLEVIDYCRAEQQPGCILFLDFEKAYDRMDRGWLMQCLQRMGFPAEAQRWVRLMLADTKAGVLYHGYLSPWFDVLSGAAQGSPLSPMLYILAAQPVAARLRQLQASGRIDGIRLPDGSLAPPCHQHADDTSIHTATVQAAAVAVTEVVMPFAASSNALLSVPKCVGMLLGPGADAPPAGVEPATGMAFVQPQDTVRHLGILLSACDQEEATRQMFAKRLTAIRLRICCWSKFDLSVLGRVHVAKQVLANSLYFHASFMLPSKALLVEIVDCIDRFVARGHWEEGPVGPMPHIPSRAVESLPWDMGGVQRADISAQVHALQAKVAAMLLHPRRQAWKTLMRRAFQRYLPALGPAVLVSALLPACAAGRNPRHVGYWKSFAKLRPHRLLQPGCMPLHQQLRERLASNCRITRRGAAGGLPPSTLWLQELSPAVADAGGLTVGGLRAALGSTDASVRHVAEQVRACVLEPAWREAVVARHLPPAAWQVSTCGQHVRWMEAPSGERGFAVRRDGRLAPLDDGCGRADGWAPAVVVWSPVAKGQQLLVKVPPPAHLVKEAPTDIDQDSSKLQPYLLGMWQDVWVDPNAWAVGPLAVSHFLVKAAARRLLLLGLKAADPEFSVANGHRPRLWPCSDGSEGLLALEQRWRDVFSDKCVSLRARQRTARRRVVEVADTPPVAAVTGRVHPLERAAAAAEQRGQCMTAFADASDTLLLGIAAGPALHPPWRKAYVSLRLARLDRLTRHFGWQLLHGALRCNAMAVLWCRVGTVQELRDAVYCSALPCCGAEALEGEQLETLSHAFMHCPVVRPAVSWLQGLWARVVAGRVPPLDARVLLAGDHTVWDPGGGDAGAELWTHLRLLFCRAVWFLRCCRTAHGQVFTAEAVVALTSSWLRRAIRLDWLRVTTNLAGTAAPLPSWCVIHKRYDMSQAEFIARWCLGAVLAHVSSDAAGSATVSVHVPSMTAVTVPLAP